MALADDIRAHAARLLAGDIELAEFEDWFVATSWNVHRNEPSAAALAYDIDLLLAELSGGHRTAKEFRAELARVLQDSWATFSLFEEPVEPSPFSAVGTELVEVSA